MKDNGFNIKIKTDWETGFVIGGNRDNCGTWMDKMGSAASNKGVPATPRDGAPIELVALQYSVLTFLANLNEQGKFAAAGVRQSSFKDWAQKIKEHFELMFFIDPYSKDRLVNRHGIYKDVVGATEKFTEF